MPAIFLILSLAKVVYHKGHFQGLAQGLLVPVLTMIVDSQVGILYNLYKLPVANKISKCSCDWRSLHDSLSTRDLLNHGHTLSALNGQQWGTVHAYNGLQDCARCQRASRCQT